MCKVVYKEHHRHMIAIAITKMKVMERDGGGADVPCNEKAIAILSHYIGDSLENNYVRSASIVTRGAATKFSRTQC
jgi:hypothetical protein